MKRWFSLACMLLLAQAPGAQAITPQAFSAFVAGLTSASARFQQTTLDRAGKVTSRAQGTLMLARPGKFRWQYDKPNKQLIVADGKRVWVYDEDLQQVTVKAQDAAVSGSPALLLAGKDELAANFTLKELPASDGLEWIEATPRNTDSGFERMRVGFASGLPARMELHDSFGNRTLIAFDGFIKNPRIEAGEFMFTPPKGVDVVGE